MIMMEKGQPNVYKEWTCHRCGLLRTNKATHVHNVPLPKDVLEAMRKRENDLRAKAAERQKNVIQNEEAESQGQHTQQG